MKIETVLVPEFAWQPYAGEVKRSPVVETEEITAKFDKLVLKYITEHPHCSTAQIVTSVFKSSTVVWKSTVRLRNRGRVKMEMVKRLSRYTAI